MILNKLIEKYGDGEQLCCVCRRPLPAHTTWPGARHPFCGSPECSKSLKAKSPFAGIVGLASKVGLYVGPNERKCDAYDCDNFLPEGRYDKRASFLTCSAQCWIHRDAAGGATHRCDCGCNEEFIGRRNHPVINGLRFKNQKHYGRFLRHQHEKEVCGALLPIAREFLDKFAKKHYGDYYTVSRLAHWFEFLKISDITDLEAVSSTTVTDYLDWAEKVGRVGVPRTIPYINTFFRWALATGHYHGGNPVNSLLHRAPRERRLPRPLESEEIALMWRLLQERGNARLRLAAALALEAGIRIGEICRVRVKDMDLVRQRVFVRLPNKTGEERFAFFSEKTKQFFCEWMRERDADCAHDALLYGKRGKPYQVKSLSRDLSQVLCTTYNGRRYNVDGFEKWSTHRLRHTMASLLVNSGADAATVMASGGWKSYSAMCGYARVDPEVARRGYDNAMREAREQKLRSPRRTQLSPAEFLQRRRQSSQDTAAQ